MRSTARLLLIALLLVTTACGWRLRGQGDITSLEGTALYLDVAAVGAELQASLERSLRTAGATLVGEPQQADAILVLLGEATQQRPVSISADARVQEYELVYSLRYRLNSVAGEVLVNDEELQSAEVYQYDSGNVLGTQSRAAGVAERLRQDVVRMLVPRLQAALRQAPRE
jgi:LPS-assembly lipoprotein